MNLYTGPLTTYQTISRESDFVHYDHYDAKGRRIGAKITRSVIEYVPVPEGQTWGNCREAGVYLCACVEATRDGQRYGASQTTMHFTSEDDRERFIAKRLIASAKAAAKKAA